jgi:hypothetical protein
MLWSLVKLSGQGDVLVALNREFYWHDGVGINAVVDSRFEVRGHYKLQYFDIYRLVRR